MQGYLLHARPFGEHGLLLDWFTYEHGRIRTRKAGARRVTKKGAGRPTPFTRYELATKGSGEWQLLTRAEILAPPYLLAGAPLAASFYLHELLLRALHPQEPVESLFLAYHHALAQLDDGAAIAPVLRAVECTLLAVSGCEPDWQYCVDGQPVHPDGFYHVLPQEGVVPTKARTAIPGRVLLTLAAGEPQENRHERWLAQQLLRRLLTPLVGPADFSSRKLWPRSA